VREGDRVIVSLPASGVDVVARELELSTGMKLAPGKGNAGDSQAERLRETIPHVLPGIEAKVQEERRLIPAAEPVHYAHYRDVGVTELERSRRSLTLGSLPALLHGRLRRR
jgi:hypothetical protein